MESATSATDVQAWVDLLLPLLHSLHRASGAKLLAAFHVGVALNRLHSVAVRCYESVLEEIRQKHDKSAQVLPKLRQLRKYRSVARIVTAAEVNQLAVNGYAISDVLKLRNKDAARKAEE